ncbi:MAG: hypothetical protein ACI7YS_06170 [Flavobacterium sp.]
MRHLLYVLFIGFLISFTSCRNELTFEPTTGNLAFSRDTVYLDTVFKNIGSATYKLKVYNKSNQDISIPTIKFGKGLDSKYRMMVDGMQGENGKIFNNVELLAKDSLFIFIEVTADVKDANSNDFLYTDQILFGTSSNLQKVEVVTLIQDAYFIYPKRENEIYETVPIGINGDNTVATVRGRNLNHNHPDNGDEFIWNSTKPYVIYGFASVPANEKLTVMPGARIHFHADSGLIVQEGGTLNINGTTSNTENMENEVVFEGDRLESFYDAVPGQWGFVYLRQGSTNHQISNLTLKNATIGFIVENNFGSAMTIKNTQIYDCTSVGIYGIHANIEGNNIVINSVGQIALACTSGGNYNFKHCTFNNNWPSSKHLSVMIDNYFLDENKQPVVFDLTEATFSNCIIYGSNSVEMLLNKNNQKQFVYQFNNCLIKFNNVNNKFTNDPLYNFSDSNFYKDCLIAKNTYDLNPNFQDVNKNKLNIDQTSSAFEKGSSDYLIPLDILGFERSSLNPDLGAYTNKPFK